VIKAFLTSLEIDFHSKAEENAALDKAMEARRKTPLLNKIEQENFLKRLKSVK
jgi:hypothetical protein